MTDAPSGPAYGGEHAPLDSSGVQSAAAEIATLDAALARVVLGQPRALREIILALLADGHVLLQGVPGVAKTLLARALASSLGLSFARVQFTPDLMPTDLLGTRIWNGEQRTWELQRGPVFTDILLADEINRTPPKTQAALLEAMEERQVTLDGERHALGPTFLVIATENPLELEGTYPLPEAQTDRFLVQVRMSYPTEDAELALLARGARPVQGIVEALPSVWSRAALLALRALVVRVRVDESVCRYVLAVLRATRAAETLRLGASPRAGLMLLRTAQAAALQGGRAFVTPEDVKAVALPVLRHRLALSTEAELDGLDAERVLTQLLAQTAIPT